MSRSQTRKHFQKQLHGVKSTELQEWLEKVSNISPEFSAAVEGIYCGREGRIHEELCDGVYITMGWHTDSTNPKVEYAYVS
jgi:hypothetical protein